MRFMLLILYLVAWSVVGAERTGEQLAIESSRHLISRGVQVHGYQVVVPETAQVTDEDLVRIADLLPKVQNLHCYSATISSQGFIALLERTDELRIVSLGGPGVTDEVIAQLGELWSLQHVDLK